MSQRTQESNSAPASQTQTTSEPSQPGSQPAQRILRLRGRQNNGGRSVQWAEDVVDNEGLGRKSSKVCCIYHKPKAVGESSDESSSSSSDSDSDADAGDSKRGNGRGADGDREHDCGHGHGDGHGHGRSTRRKRPDGSGKDKRPPSPNAYEKIPKVKPKTDDEPSK